MNNEFTLSDAMGRDDRRVVIVNTPTYVETWIREDGHIRIEKAYPLGRLFADTQRRRNEFSRTQKLDDMVLVSQVPMAMHLEWQKEGRIEDEKSMRRFFNDSDNANFRTNNLIL